MTQILLDILAMMIVMWFSRCREFCADGGGARLAVRDSTIDALRGLRRVHQPELPRAIEAFGIALGNSGGALRSIFMSHPPLEERIAALQRQG